MMLKRLEWQGYVVIHVAGLFAISVSSATLVSKPEHDGIGAIAAINGNAVVSNEEKSLQNCVAYFYNTTSLIIFIKARRKWATDQSHGRLSHATATGRG